MSRVLRWLSRLAPRWRRDEWLREWSAEIASAGEVRPVALTVGAAAHVLWLWRHDWSLDTLTSDVRDALRALTRRPAFTLTVLATLTLGIGATIAMFTVVDAVVLRGLPYPHADRVVAIWPEITLAPRQLADAERSRDGFAAIGAYSGWGFTLTGGARAEEVDGARITPNLLEVLGVAPILGRGFDAGAVQPGRDRVALIGDGLWRRRFGADPAVVGGALAIEGVNYTIVGVMPAAFEFPTKDSEVWTPIPVDPSADDFAANFLSLLGRLAPGVTPAQARDRLRPYRLQLHRDFPQQFSDRFLQSAQVTPLQARLVRTIRKPLLLLFAAVGLVLIIACANTAHLLLVRSVVRDGEMALRSALGATRARLIRQLLVESVVLAGAGGAAGLVVAWWLVRAFQPFVQDLPDISRAAVVDPRVAAFALIVILGSAVLFGLAPALQSSRSDLPAVIGSGRGGSHSARRPGLRRGLVWMEVTLAMLLVVSAAMLGRSYVHLTNVDLGFRPDHVLTLHVSAPEFRYQTDDQLRALYRDLFARVRALPGVERAGAIHLLPLTSDNWNPGVTVDDWPAAEQFPHDVNWRVVTPGYFQTMDITLRTGRAFAAADDQHAPAVAIVNDAFVRQVFRGRPALGRRIRTAFEGRTDWATVVGVVGDVHQEAVDVLPQPEMYRPFAQHPLNSLRLMVRAAGEPGALAPAVRAAISGLDTDIALDDVDPLSAVVDHALGGARLPLELAWIFSLVALVLGFTGVAGILSFDVHERRAEIGLRLALGASPARIRRSFLARGLGLGAAGVLGGGLAARAVSGLLRSLLFGVDPADPLTIGAVGAILLVVIAAAAYLPARRAARLDPMMTLRAP